MPLLEAKPLPALFTAMVLAGLRQPIIHPAACDLERLGPIFVNNPASNDMSSSGTGVSTTSHSGVSREQVRRETHCFSNIYRLGYRPSLSHIKPLEFRRLFVSCVALGCSLTSKGSAGGHSSHLSQTHHRISRSPKQSVLFLVHCPTRLDCPSQDIASFYTSTSCMRAASRLGVGPSIRRHACSPNSFSTRTWHLRTVRRAHTNISFPSHTSMGSSSRGIGELIRTAASFMSSCWRIPDQS